jgi:hypothetical protein
MKTLLWALLLHPVIARVGSPLEDIVADPDGTALRQLFLDEEELIHKTGEGPCEQYDGKAKGLCNAYCVAQECVNNDGKKSCEQLKDNFEKITGLKMFPCEEEEVACPCWEGADLDQFNAENLRADFWNYKYDYSDIVQQAYMFIRRDDQQSLRADIWPSDGRMTCLQGNSWGDQIELSEDEYSACKRSLLEYVDGLGLGVCQTRESADVDCPCFSEDDLPDIADIEQDRFHYLYGDPLSVSISGASRLLRTYMYGDGHGVCDYWLGLSRVKVDTDMTAEEFSKCFNILYAASAERQLNACSQF